MFTVYVLKSTVFKKSYVGYTVDLVRRLEEHNSGKGNYTKKFMPWTVIYTEDYQNENEAKKREKYLKSKVGRNFLKTVFSKLI